MPAATREHPRQPASTGGAARGLVRVGVVGLGRIGRVHAANLASGLSCARLGAVFDVEGAQANAVSAELGADVAASYDELLKAVDAVVIASPAPTHPQLVHRAARAGKHIFCEKPLATDLAQSRRMDETVRAAGVTLQVGFHLRFDPEVATLAERVKAGELGEVLLLRASLRDMKPPGREYLRMSGGLVVDGGIHLFDLARWMVSDLVEVTAVAASRAGSVPRELHDADRVITVGRFSTGGLGLLENCREAGYGFDFQLEVIGSRTSARIDSTRRSRTSWLTPGAWTTVNVTDFIQRFPEAYRLEMESFARALVQGESPRASGAEAVQAMEICDLATLSLAERRTVSAVAGQLSNDRITALP